MELMPVKRLEDWMLYKLYQTTYPEHETLRILKTLIKYAHVERDIFCIIEVINEHTVRMKPLNDLADDCLISVALFSDYLKKRRLNRAYPDVKWYYSIGKQSFEKLGYYDISRHYDFWLDYLKYNIFEELTKKKDNTDFSIDM